MKNGFTLVELLIVLGLTFVLVVVAVPLYGGLQVKAQLSETSAQVVQVLRQAQQNSLAGFNNFSHGIFFNLNSVGPDSYVLYQGSSYSTRNTNYDRVQTLDSVLDISNSSFVLTNGNIDINFSKGLGAPSNVGSLYLVHAVQGTSTISVNSFGKVEKN